MNETIEAMMKNMNPGDLIDPEEELRIIAKEERKIRRLRKEKHVQAKQLRIEKHKKFVRLLFSGIFKIITVICFMAWYLSAVLNQIYYEEKNEIFQLMKGIFNSDDPDNGAIFGSSDP